MNVNLNVNVNLIKFVMRHRSGRNDCRNDGCGGGCGCGGSIQSVAIFPSSTCIFLEILSSSSDYTEMNIATIKVTSTLATTIFMLYSSSIYKLDIEYEKIRC
mmetsp:Transcript_22780/g.24236  ORF Transcript_22780/g.24236 Transcript_22780/m.24236 type:complete len:102 (+) Transcript_22780:681-986(+)